MIIKQIVVRTDELISEYKEYIFQVGKKCRSLYQDHYKRNEKRKKNIIMTARWLIIFFLLFFRVAGIKIA
jgi:hypothetical protein